MISKKIVRIAKITGYVFASLIGLLILAIASIYISMSIDREDTFYVRGASFEGAYWPDMTGDSDSHVSLSPQEIYDREVAAPFVAHHLRQDPGSVFGYRFYSDGMVMAIDDEEFQKVSIWIDGDVPKNDLMIELGDKKKIVVIYTKGGSAWPRSACAGSVINGSVEFKPRRGKIHVSLRGMLSPAKNKEDERCRHEEIKLEFDAKEMALEKITPWLGAAGRHIYDESYRR